MQDDVILNKVAIIERCVGRALEEYETDPDSFASNYTRQDAAILNIQRACEAALDIGQHIIRTKQLGLPQSARDVFELLRQHHWLNDTLATNLKKMIGFRNIAVHDYQTLQLPITINIIENHLQDFLQFTKAIIQHPG
jgi:uncharacterized protein YutE (UPF0331/DUF86 family)